MAVSLSISAVENSTNISANTSSVTVTLKASWTYGTYYHISGTASLTIDGTTYNTTVSKLNPSNSTSGSQALFTKTVNVSHNSDGSKSLSVSGSYLKGVSTSITWATERTVSTSLTLTKIPRQAALTSAPNFTDEGNPTIKYSNPAGNAVTTLQACISLDRSAANIAYRDISKTGSSYTFNLTDAERLVLRKAAANSNTLTVYFYVKTVIGSNTYYSSLEKTMTIVNANPTIGSVSYEDTNSTTSGITENNQIIIQGQSTVQFTVNTLTALKSATLYSVSVTCNNQTVKSTLSGTTASTASLNLGSINSVQDVTATITLTDSRGNTATKTVTVTMEEYSLPSAIITCGRLNNFYTETLINVNGEISSLAGKNVMEITVQSKKTTDSDYGDSQKLADNVETTLELDNSYAWNIKVVISDLIGSTTYNLFVDKGIPIVFFDRLNSSMGVNCFPESGEFFQIAGNSNAFMLSGMEQIPASSNLNDYMTAGNYCCTLNATAATLSNCPLTMAFTMQVYHANGTGSYIAQTVKKYAAPFEEYTRYYIVASGDWSAWFQTGGVDAFHARETYNVVQYDASGHLTNALKDLVFTILLPKPLGSDVSNIKLTTTVLEIRAVGGGYIVNDNLPSSGLTTTISCPSGANNVHVSYRKSTNWTIGVTGGTAVANNTPISVYLTGVLAFS